jgi:allantoin racemase
VDLLAQITQQPAEDGGEPTPPPGCELVEYTYQNPFAGSEPVTWRVADLIVAATGIRAVQDGCDAIIVNALSDFGVRIMRDVMRGPIVGAAYAVSCAAGAFGDRYSLVDIWPPASCEVVNQRFRDYGIFDKFASLRFLHEDSFMGDAKAVATNFAEVTTCDIRYVNREPGSAKVEPGGGEPATRS